MKGPIRVFGEVSFDHFRDGTRVLGRAPFNQGAVVLTAARVYSEVKPQADIEVIDTVGAGDAFSAAMILGLTSGWALDLALRGAQGFASALVARRGATLDDRGFYRNFLGDRTT